MAKSKTAVELKVVSPPCEVSVVCVLQRGKKRERMICGTKRERNRVARVFWSDDDGKTWSSVNVGDKRGEGVSQLSAGETIMHLVTSQGRIFLSLDDGETWRGLVRVPVQME